MQAVDEAVDDVAREQLQVLDPRQDLRIDEARAGNDVGFHAACRVIAVRPEPALYMPDFGMRHDLQQLVDQRVGRDAFRLGAEVREHAVPQHRDAPCARMSSKLTW